MVRQVVECGLCRPEPPDARMASEHPRVYNLQLMRGEGSLPEEWPPEPPIDVSSAPVAFAFGRSLMGAGARAVGRDHGGGD